MTMKLSNKGVDKLYAQVWMNQEDLPQDKVFEFENLNFDQSDFQDCVMLSVKEAKEILQSSYDVLSWSMVGPTHRDNALSVQKLLKYRIEQAEMSKQST